jgi:hypothetical protein
MTEILWNIDVEYYSEDDIYHMAVSALTGAETEYDTEITVHAEYGHQPTQMDAEYLKDEALEILFDAGLYSGGNDE